MIKKFLLFLIIGAILFTWVKYTLETIQKNVNSEELLDSDTTLRVRDINELVPVKNEAFLNSIFPFSELRGEEIKKSWFTYISKIIFVVGKPIVYWQDTCKYNEDEKKLNCITESKDFKKYWQILKIDVSNTKNGRKINKKSFTMLFPDFLFSTFYDTFVIETKDRYKIEVSNPVIMSTEKERLNTYYERLKQLKGEE